jgi:hypothetical protein
LTGERADVDELRRVSARSLRSSGIAYHVEVKKDTRKGDVGVRDDALACLGIQNHARLRLAVLLSDQRRDISLESTGSETQGNDTEDERRDSVAAREDCRNGRDNEQDMAKDAEGNGDEDGVEAAEILISDDSTNDGSCIGPEGVELADTERSSLTHAQGTWLTFISRTGGSASGLQNTIDDREVLLDEVCVYQTLVSR